MIQNQNRQNLAETLARTGLAASAGEAARMAESIVGTEHRVSKHFDQQNKKIDDSLTRKRTYKEEIDYLIEKTSMENKNFHIPIRGYPKQEDIPTSEVKVEVQEEKPKLEVVDLPEEKSQIKEFEELIQEPAVEESEDVYHELEEPEIEEAAPEIEEKAPEAEEPAPVEEAKPMFVQDVKNKDILDDERSLMEVMNEDAQEIYSNKQEEPKETPEYNVVNVESPSFESNKPEEAKEDEFIIGESAAPAEPEPDQVLSNEPKEAHENQGFSGPSNSEGVSPEPEQMFKEIKEDKPKNAPPKNPIENVDLMDYFKFG